MESQYWSRPIYSSIVFVIILTVTILTVIIPTASMFTVMVRIRIVSMTGMLSNLVEMMSVRIVTV